MKTLFMLLLSLCSYGKEVDLVKNLAIRSQKYTLDNGLKVILSKDSSQPFVAINIWYHVGAINEDIKNNKTGLAHLFEHLMFEGSRFVKKDQHIRLLEQVGGFSFNASTSFDKTNYYMTLPKNRLELGLFLESSRMSFLDISKEKLNEQREVVRREREQRFENSPYQEAVLSLWQKIFPKNSPYHGMVIGSHQDLQSASLLDIKSFYNQFYGPSNATLVLVGDFEINESKRLIHKYFASLPKSKKIKEEAIKPPTIAKEEIIYYEEKLGTLPFLRISYITPALFENGDAELDILAHILSYGESARLVKALTRDEEIANSINVYQQSMQFFSIFNIEVLLKPKIDEKIALAKIDNILNDINKKPPTATEINRAKNTILTDYFFRLQNIGGPNGLAEILNSYDRYAKKPDFIKEDVKRYLNIDAKKIIATKDRFLKKHQRKVLFAIPGNKR